MRSKRPTVPEHDPEEYLRVDHLSGDLRGRSVRGGVVTLANQAGKFIVTVGSTAILARLLTPEDFGLIAMVLSIIGFIATFKDMGLAMATVQRAGITHAQVSTLFWFNLMISALMMIATAAIGPLLAWFYREPRVSSITVVLAGTIIFSGLTVQHQAILRRQMRFAALAAVEIVSLTLGAAVAVTAALRGVGYWSLVLLPLVKEVTMTVGVWSFCRWRPGPPVRRAGVRGLISFGAHLTGFNIVNYFARNLDKILIGQQWGAAPLGLYNKAYQLVLLPMQQINTPITSVAMPTLSRLQGQLERYRAYYRRGVLLTVTVGMPIVTFLVVDAERAVETILGGQWTASVPIFRALGPAAFIGTFSVATGWVYVSLGMTKRQFGWGIFASVVTTVAYFVGLRWGPIGVALASSIALTVLRLPAVLYCFRSSHLRLKDLGVALWRPTVASLAAGLMLWPAVNAVRLDMPILIVLAADFLLFMIFYMLIWVVLPGGRTSAGDMARLVRDVRSAPPTPPAA